MFCKKCGAELRPNMAFCSKCGEPVAPENTAPISGPTRNPYYGTHTGGNKNFSRALNNGIDNMQQSDSFVFRSLGLTLKTLFSKPIRLWGLSLLGSLLSSLSKILCSVPPIFGRAVNNTIETGMQCVYLDAYNGKSVDSKQIFSGFSSGKQFVRISAGTLWRSLWLLIWLMVPIAGIICRIYKSYSYSFTPYILLKKQDIHPLDALKLSMQLTKGFKGKMFLTHLFVAACMLGLFIGMILFSFIPFLGILINLLLTLIIIALAPLFSGILQAAMFTEVLRLKGITDIKL